MKYYHYQIGVLYAENNSNLKNYWKIILMDDFLKLDTIFILVLT